MVVFNRLDATDAGAHRNTDGVTVLFGYFQPGVLDRLDAGRNAVVNKRVGSCGHLSAACSRSASKLRTMPPMRVGNELVSKSSTS